MAGAASSGTRVTPTAPDAHRDNLLFGRLRRDLTPLVEDLAVHDALDSDVPASFDDDRNFRALTAAVAQRSAAVHACAQRVVMR